MYTSMQHLNASVPWLVSVLGPVFMLGVGFILLNCIYADVCLWNVNQYYRKKIILNSKNEYFVFIKWKTLRL